MEDKKPCRSKGRGVEVSILRPRGPDCLLRDSPTGPGTRVVWGRPHRIQCEVVVLRGTRVLRVHGGRGPKNRSYKTSVSFDIIDCTRRHCCMGSPESNLVSLSKSVARLRSSGSSSIAVPTKEGGAERLRRKREQKYTRRETRTEKKHQTKKLCLRTR